MQLRWHRHHELAAGAIAAAISGLRITFYQQLLQAHHPLSFIFRRDVPGIALKLYLDDTCAHLLYN